MTISPALVPQRGALARGLTLLTVLAALLAGSALASQVRATVDFPQGLQPGQTVPVTVTLAPADDGESAKNDFQRLKGSRVELVLAGGQYGINQQYTLGKIGGDLKGKVKVAGIDRYQIGLRFVNSGQNYGSTVDLDAPSGARTIQMIFDGPVAQKRLPLPQLLLWAAGAAVLGLVALRGVSAFG